MPSACPSNLLFLHLLRITRSNPLVATTSTPCLLFQFSQQLLKKRDIFRQMGVNLFGLGLLVNVNRFITSFNHLQPSRFVINQFKLVARLKAIGWRVALYALFFRKNFNRLPSQIKTQLKTLDT